MENIAKIMTMNMEIDMVGKGEEEEAMNGNGGEEER